MPVVSGMDKLTQAGSFFCFSGFIFFLQLVVFYTEKACEFLNLPLFRINLPLLFEHQAMKLS